MHMEEQIVSAKSVFADMEQQMPKNHQDLLDRNHQETSPIPFKVRGGLRIKIDMGQVNRK